MSRVVMSEIRFPGLIDRGINGYLACRLSPLVCHIKVSTRHLQEDGRLLSILTPGLQGQGKPLSR